MKIKKLYVDAYKNLTKCDLSPSSLHAITGVNGSGKSNFLEIFQFIAALITRDDTFRDSMLLDGHCPSGNEWFPMSADGEAKPTPFQFKIDCEVGVNNDVFLVNYSIEIADALTSDDRPFKLTGQGLINCETIDVKKLGTPGPMKSILNRNSEGEVIIHSETGSRKVISFKTKKNMSAIQALEVREADEFSDKHPILNQFKIGLISSVVVKLNPESIAKLAKDGIKHKPRSRPPGTQLTTFSLFEAIKSIQKKDSDWQEYNHWLYVLCNIDSIDAYSYVPDESIVAAEQKLVFIHREGRVLVPHELSTGNLVLVSLVTALFSLLRTSGVVIFEEPETYIHPKALIDLISLFRDISEIKTVLFSTHSPVVLNSMRPEEVSLMLSSGNGRYTSRAVKDIKEASRALTRGYISFGDLLQSNFMTDQDG